MDLTRLSLKEILLGVPDAFPKAHQVNLLLLLARYFIHRQRLFHGCELNIVHWRYAEGFDVVGQRPPGTPPSSYLVM